jgi:hypothetical protein
VGLLFCRSLCRRGGRRHVCGRGGQPATGGMPSTRERD